jgi:mRNA-degrading endonuclease RelE of RelBE toxin-antitoxin system
MKYEFKPSFDRSVKSLPPEIKQEVKELCITLIDVLSGEQELSVGRGLKNLRKNFLVPCPVADKDLTYQSLASLR